MKNSKKNFVIALLIVLLLALAVGYASFSDTLNINGTATIGTGSWDIHFESATVVGDSSATGAPSATVSISADAIGDDTNAKDTVTVSVPNLNYPGAGANFQAVIVNAGSITAKTSATDIKAAIKTGTEIGSGADALSEEDILVKFPNLPSEVTLKPGDKLEIDFFVQWNPASTSTEAKSVNFDYVIPFEQDVTTQQELQGVVDNKVIPSGQV